MTDLEGKIQEKIFIAKDVFKKMKIIQDIVKNTEWYVYLLYDLDDKSIVGDVYFPTQEADMSSVRVINVEEEYNEVKDRIIGWGHSHGEMSSFFSSKDDRNISNVANLAFKNTSRHLRYYQIGNVPEKDFDKEKKRVYINFYSIKTSGTCKDCIEVYEEQKLSWVYSLTINSRYELYGEVVYSIWSPIRGKVYEKKIKNAKIEIVDRHRSVGLFYKHKMKKLIKKRLHKLYEPIRYLSWWEKWKGMIGR